jgi:D-sedoheptulose 7-phosphate isomerase
MHENSILGKLRDNLRASVAAKEELLASEAQQRIFAGAVQAVVECYRKGGRLYIAGNGGSAADAQHLATEFISKLARVRAPLPAEALTVDTSTLTAIGNDFGFDELFARQLMAKAKAGDTFLAITTSGKSRNILRALEECRALKVPSIVFTGGDGGKTESIADYVVRAPGRDTSCIQEVHQVLYHTLCACVEAAIFPV